MTRSEENGGRGTEYEGAEAVALGFNNGGTRVPLNDRRRTWLRKAAENGLRFRRVCDPGRLGQNRPGQHTAPLIKAIPSVDVP